MRIFESEFTVPLSSGWMPLLQNPRHLRNLRETIPDGTTRTETSTGATELEFVESWADPYVRTGAGLSFEPSHTGIYTFQLASADDVIDVTIGDLVVHGEFYSGCPETNALFVAGHSYPITVRTENYGGPAALTWQKFAEFSPVPRARLNASFTKKAVIFENYRHGNPDVPNRHRSTKTVLEIFANGGALGGTVSYSILNDSKLMSATTFGRPQSSQTLNESDTFALRFPYKGCIPSETGDDIQAIVRLEENLTHEVSVVTAAVTSVGLSIAATERFPVNRNRHVFGPEESAIISQTPTNLALVCVALFDNGGFVSNRNESVGSWLFSAPPRPAELSVAFFAAESETYSMPLSVIGPERLIGKNPRVPTREEWETRLTMTGMSDFPENTPMVVMALDRIVFPDFVNFRNIWLWEESCFPTNRTGLYCDRQRFADEVIGHTAAAGAVNDPVQRASRVSSVGNEVIGSDLAGNWFEINGEVSPGSFELHIPVLWTGEGATGVSNPYSMQNAIQKITVFDDFSMKVEKCGVSLRRYFDGRIE